MGQIDEVLSIAPQNVAGFIRQRTAERSLSGLVRRLNDALLDGDAESRARAQRALDHLGLSPQP